MHIKSIQEGKTFELLSAHTGMNYSNLIFYIDPNDKTLYSKKLAVRITRILNNEYSQFYKSICNCYFDYVSTSCKNKIIKWIKSELNLNFDFELFAVLIQTETKINKKIVELLKNHLRKRCNTIENKSGIQVYPQIDKYADLNNVGYWVHVGLLPKNEFREFVGISDNFDFYYLYEQFDFSKFNVDWLFNLYPNTYKSIVKSEKVKVKIRIIISEMLQSNIMNNSRQKQLASILVKWFC